MSTTPGDAKKRKGGSKGLNVLLQWIRSLNLSRTKRDVMFVFAEHSSWWDGTGSRPGLPTIMKKTGLSKRHAQRLIEELEQEGHLIMTAPPRGVICTTYKLNVRLPLAPEVDANSAVSTESTGEKSTNLLEVTSGAARGDISERLEVTFRTARGDISEHAIRKTVKAPLSTTVKAPASAGAAAAKNTFSKLDSCGLTKLSREELLQPVRLAAEGNPWEKLVHGLKQKVLKQLDIVIWSRGGTQKYWDGDRPRDPQEQAEYVRGLWFEACQRADIFPQVAQKIADHFYIQAGGRIQPEHSPSAFRSPGKKKAAGGEP